jgi:hypothetical protein
MPKFGARPRRLPLPLRWKGDQDYWDKLSVEEKQWLTEFNNAHYQNAFESDVGSEWDDENKATTRAANRAAMDDVYGQASAVGAISEFRPGEQDYGNAVDPALPLKYLNSEEYKAARDEFRDQLPKTRKLLLPKETPKFHSTRAQLEKVVAHGTPPEEVPSPDGFDNE